MLPLIGSILLSVGVKLGVDLISKAWKGGSDGAKTPASSTTTSSTFGTILKDRTAAVATATDAAPASAASPATATQDTRRLGLDDTAAALLYGPNANTGNVGQGAAATSTNDVIASYLRNIPQAG